MKNLIFLMGLFIVSENALAVVKGYIAPKIMAGYAFQNSNHTIDGEIQKEQMNGLTYGVGLYLVRHDVSLGARYRNDSFDDMDHNYYLADLGLNLISSVEENFGFGFNILLGWDNYEWKNLPTPVNKYSTDYEGGSFAYGVGISFFYRPAKQWYMELAYEGVETRYSDSNLVPNQETDPQGTIGFGPNSSFTISIAYGFGVGRYEPPKELENENKSEAEKGDKK